MVRRVLPFRHWHYAWLGLKAEPGEFMIVPQIALEQLERENSWTGMVDGEVVFCAGTVKQWPTRHTSWALLHPMRAAEHTLWTTHAVLAELEKVKGRIEMTVRADFPAGHKWAKILGFHVETPLLKAFGPQGEDHVGYVRIN